MVGSVRRKEEMTTSISSIADRCEMEPNSGCWLWRGALAGRDGHQYATMKLHRKMVKVHRVVHELHSGAALKEGEVVCHRCDTPSCVNPSHLFRGTLKDNSQDSLAKGRNYIGDKNPRATLSADDVRTIRSQLGADVGDLASRYGVTESTIHMIRRRATWKHLPGGYTPSAAEKREANLKQLAEARRANLDKRAKS